MIKLESYNITYLLNYSNFMHALNKHVKNYKTELQFEVTGIINNKIEVLDSIKHDVYTDAIDVYNFIKEIYHYTDADAVAVEVYDVTPEEGGAI